MGSSLRLSAMYDGSEAELLTLLAERAGIAGDYYDILGAHHVTTRETKQAILAAMGFRVDSREVLAEELTRLDDAPWAKPCDTVVVMEQGVEDAGWSFRLALSGGDEHKISIAWELRDEGGDLVKQGEAGPKLIPEEVRYVQGNRHVRFRVALPSGLPVGYYDLTASAVGSRYEERGSLKLIVAPSHCHVPKLFQAAQKVWGLALQLYSLRSVTNWGVGDFTDLRNLVEWAGQDLGASLIGVNPLHALRNTRPHHISPYAPQSRLYVNELYIDIERLPEFHSSPDARRVRSSQEFQAALEGVRKVEQVNYDVVSHAKRTMLDLAYRQFLHDNYHGTEPSLQPTSARGWLLERFIREEGDPLEQYGVFQVLEEERRLVDGRPVAWREWPIQYRSPESPAVREFARRHRKRVRFFQYIQWIAAEQLRDVSAMVSASRMAIGLYRDLALGSDRDGAESWMMQHVLALDADCGAPPDAFAPQGQNWGFAPFHPLRLKEMAYRPYIELLRKNLRDGGAIRLDHVMALFRLFWVPRGLPASAGAYVHYPSEDLLSILALESVRAQTLVIGEDLGTVPDWVRDQLARKQILSYRVFYFERTEKGRWKPPAAYPDRSLAVVTTHDLPTLSGFWTGEDIYLRAGVGIYPTDQDKNRALDERQQDKAKILTALKAEGLLPQGLSEDPASAPNMTPELCEAIHQYLARGASAIVLINVDDVIGEVTQINLPGTVDSYPNWSRKLSRTLDELRQDERVLQLACTMRAVRAPT
ncbi:MAG: 4-alpha-glucanotransferase [Nitrospiraceae bacterium]